MRSARCQHNVKKRYEGVRGGGGRNLSKKRYVIVERPLLFYSNGLAIYHGSPDIRHVEVNNG